MRIAALYDVHGNLPALEAVLDDLERDGGVDAIVVGGDVLWGPMQSECLELLQTVGATFVSGNCERDVLSHGSDVDRWCYERLGDRDRALVASWPRVAALDVDGLGHVVCCHATPRDDEEILTRITPDEEVVGALASVDADVFVCGHTHVQYDRVLRKGPRVVNAGSVGLPYEGVAGAFWALVGPGIELRRTVYDTVRALARLRETEFPRLDEIFAGSLEGRVTADAATLEFESRRGT